MPCSTVTVPWAGSVASVISSGPASMSVSLARTSNVVAPESSATVAAVVDRDRRVVDARDGDRDGRRVAAVDGVGEVVGDRRAVVGVGRVGHDVRRALVDRHGAVGGVADGGDLERAAVDVGVVGEHVERRRAGVLGDGPRVVDRDRRVVDAGDGHRDRRGVAAVDACR